MTAGAYLEDSGKPRLEALLPVCQPIGSTMRFFQRSTLYGLSPAVALMLLLLPQLVFAQDATPESVPASECAVPRYDPVEFMALVEEVYGPTYRPPSRAPAVEIVVEGGFPAVAIGGTVVAIADVALKSEYVADQDSFWTAAAILRQHAACANTGDTARVVAMWTDAWIVDFLIRAKQSQLPLSPRDWAYTITDGTPSAPPDEFLIAAPSVLVVWRLSDGGLAAFTEYRGHTSDGKQPLSVVVLRAVDKRWLIDDVIPVVDPRLPPSPTPTPYSFESDEGN